MAVTDGNRPYRPASFVEKLSEKSAGQPEGIDLVSYVLGEVK